MIEPIQADELLYFTKVDQVFQRIVWGASISTETINWLDTLGVCDAGCEKARHFRAMESGAFACLGWPDAPREHQRLISDMLCIGFAIDDMYDGDAGVHTGDCPLSEILDVLPQYLAGADSAVFPNSGPLYRSMADLRARLISQGASPDWMELFAKDFRGWLTAVREEVRLKESQRIPYISQLLAIRPASGAAFVFSNFIQTAYDLGIERDRFLRDDLCQLRTLVARIVIYPNDLLSFARESRNGHSMNILTALCHHQRMTLPEAMRTLVAMHNEDTAKMHGLALRVRSRATSPTVRSYVNRLEQFVHGLFEWGLYAARYSHELLAPYIEESFDDFPAIPEEIAPQKQRDSDAVALC